jgi:hypothetical protein
VRTLTTEETKAIAYGPGYFVWWTVEVKDAGGTWRDLSSLEGFDWRVAVRWNDDADQPVAALSLTLVRDHTRWLSLAPLRTDSKLNKLTGSYEPLLQEGREIRLKTAVKPIAFRGTPSAPMLSFEGYIEDVDSTGGEIQVEALDKGSLLQATFIETERTYSNDVGTALATVLQSILDDNLGGGVVTLNTVGTPSWSVKKFVQPKLSTFEAVQAKALNIGWDTRYRWDSASSSFKFTLYEPDRAKTVPDFTLDPALYKSVTQLKQTRRDVRNVWSITYSDRADLDEKGVPKRKTRTVSDATSITRYGRRYAEISEDAASGIDTATEADRMINAALSDTKDPKADHILASHFLPHLDVGDLIRCKANGVHYDNDQDLAVVSVSHELSASVQQTTVALRGKPCGPRLRMLKLVARPDADQAAPTVAPDAPTSVTATPVQGGVAVKFSPPTNPTRPAAEYEVHYSTSSSFTVSSSTLFRAAGADGAERGDLVPGTTYYFKVVARDEDGNRSAVSSEVSAVAGYTQPRAMQPFIATHRLPPNGDFELRNVAGQPPDTWAVSNGTWGTHFDLYEAATSQSYSGSNSLWCDGISPHTIRSQTFTVTAGERWYVVFHYKTAATSGVRVGIQFLDKDGAADSFQEEDPGVAASYTQYRMSKVAPSTARFAYVYFAGRDGGAGADFYVDKVEVFPGDPQDAWTTPTFGTNWGAGAAGQAPGYMRDTMGFVHLRGNVRRSGAGTTVINALPLGFRPAGNETFLTYDSATGGVLAVTVNTTGTVTISGTTVLTDYSLSGITFAAA